MILSRTQPKINREQRTETRFYLFLGLMLLWVWVQSLAMLEMLPGVWIQRFLTLKNLSSLGPVVLGTLLYIDKIRVNSLAIPPLAFAWYAFVNVSINILVQELPLTGLYPASMYFVWAWALFVVIPTAFDTSRRLAVFLRLAIWGTAVILIWGSALAILAGRPIFVHSGHSYSTVRYTFGFRHPGYIAHLLAVIPLSGLILRNLSTSRVEKLTLFLLSVVALVLLIAADSRTNVLLVFTSFSVSWLVKSKRRSRWIIIVWALSLSVLLWFTLMSVTNMSSPDYQIGILDPSGRFEIWGNLISQTFDNTTTVGRLLVGQGFVGGVGGFKSSSTPEGEFATTEFRISRWDNGYIEAFISYGLVGLALFLWIFYKLLKDAFRVRSMSGIAKSVYNNVCLSIGLIAGILVMGLVVSNMPSVGNLIYAVLLPSGIAVVLANCENRYDETNAPDMPVAKR